MVKSDYAVISAIWDGLILFFTLAGGTYAAVLS